MLVPTSCGAGLQQMSGAKRHLDKGDPQQNAAACAREGFGLRSHEIRVLHFCSALQQPLSGVRAAQAVLPRQDCLRRLQARPLIATHLHVAEAA